MALSPGMLWTGFLALWASLISAFNPSQDSELTFLLPAGSSECFYQTSEKNGTLEVEYQVPAFIKYMHTDTSALGRV